MSTRRCGLLWARVPASAQLASGPGWADEFDGDPVWHAGNRFLMAFDDPFGAVGAARSLLEFDPAAKLVLHFGRLLLGGAREADDEPWGPAWEVVQALGALGEAGQALATGAFGEWVRLEDTIGVDFFDLGRRQLRLAAEPVRVLALEFGQRVDTPQLSLGATNLARPRGGFVGRRAELLELESLCRPNKLVTVLGMGGAGKTRLALEFGGRFRQRHPRADVWFVDLAQVESFSELSATISATFEVRLSASTPRDKVLSALGDALKARGQALIILDNAEQIIPELADCLQQWLPTAPQVRWLVTSRRRLGLDAEQLVELAPLDEACAVGLFVRRLQCVRPDFALTEAHLETIVELVDRLERLPLAIEIAASRARLSPLDELGTQLLDARRVVPGAEARRDASLADVVAWSWRLLSQRERDVLAQCTVFAGVFTLQAARGVVDACPDDQLEEVLTALAEHSLLETLEAPRSGGEVALRLYLPVVEFVREHADEATLRAAERRHLSVYADCASRWYGAARGPGMRAALERIGFEFHELRAALARAAAAADPRAAHLGLALCELYSVRGAARPALELLEEVLALDDIEQQPRPYARLLIARSYLYNTEAMVGAAGRDARLARDVLAEAGIDDEDTAEALRMLARACITSGDSSQADKALDEALEAASGAGGAGAQALVLYEMSGRLVDQGDWAEAINTASRGLELVGESENPRIPAMLYSVRGLAALYGKQFDDARHFSQKSLELFEQLGMRRSEGLTLLDVGDLAVEQGEFSRAITLLQRALRIGRRHAIASITTGAYMALGETYMLGGDAEKARRYLREGLATIEADDVHLLEIVLTMRLGAVQWVLGQHAEATALLAQAEAFLETYPQGSWHAVLRAYRAMLTIPADTSSEKMCEAVDAAREQLQQIRQGHDELAVDRALRFVERVLESYDCRVRAEEEEQVGLVVDASGRWFELPQEERVDISRRGALRRILERLVTRRLDAPGDPLDIDELVVAGWPDQTLDPGSAKNRLYVAVSTLRDLGLRGVLLNEDGGYLLSPDQPVRRQQPGE
ncbi:MAG: ATP-binding protein [Persicimonas sp.]